MKKAIEREAYEVGALLYTPAINDKVFEMIINQKIQENYSLSLCLEDSIDDSTVELAENQVTETLKYPYEYKKNNDLNFNYPKIFVRVRMSSQIKKIFNNIKNFSEIFSGFIIPKYSLENADEYNSSISELNSVGEKTIYMMPILESSDIIKLDTRATYLCKLKEKIDEIREMVLNVRVGGNDFCKEFMTRRNYNQTIYDITPVRNILSDILTVFSREYVVSGPVWEYFASQNNEWKIGLSKEISLDLINGFIGKTVIHPNQVSILNDQMKVSRSDYEDAIEVLSWRDNRLAVGKSYGGERMNEWKVHLKWAEKIKILSEVYGVR